MRKLIYVLAVAAVVMASCSSKGKYNITGTAEGAIDGEYVYLMDHNGMEPIKLDSVAIANGAFTFKGVQEPAVVRYLAYTDGENEPLFMEFFLEEGNIQVQLMHDPSAAKATGTPTNDAYEDFKSEMASINTQMGEVYSVLRDTATSAEDKEKNIAEMRRIESEMVEMIKNQIKKNINTPLGVNLLEQYHFYIEYDDLEELLAQMPGELSRSAGIMSIREQVATASKTAVGQKFVDLEMLTPEGEPVKLSDYAGNGKVVMVDFWASWCGPCRGEMPRLVKMYDKYKNKGFEIVGVSFDNNGDSWKKGIEQLNMTWPQMSDLKYWQSEGARQYAIRSIPHVVIIDKDGIIISRGLYGDELEAEIDEIMS